MRRFLYVSPIFSLPILCTMETGFLLYLLSSSVSLFAINYALNTLRVRQLFAIPEYLPGTKLEKLVFYFK
jgi:hypothetical protein